MKLKLCAAVATLMTSAVVSAATSSLVGKGVICLNDKDEFSSSFAWNGHHYVAYKFSDDGKATRYHLSDGEQAVEPEEGRVYSYKANAGEVTLRSNADGAGRWVLNRQSGTLDIFNGTGGRSVMTWECESYADPEAFEAGMKKTLKDEN